MKNSKKALIFIAIIVGLLLILPFLISMQTYLREVEKVASEKLGVPVTIDSAHLFLLPSPRVIASDIVVGKNQEIKLDSLVMSPTIGSLLSSTKIIDLNMSKPVIDKAALEIVSALTAQKSENGEPAAINIRHIKIDDLQVVWPGMRIPVMHIEATLTDNKLESATLQTDDGKLEAIVTPNGDEHSIVVNADKWSLPIGLPLLIDAAKLDMQLKADRLIIPKIDIALYRGKIVGNAVLSWQENKGKVNWKTSGKLSINNLSVKEPSSMLSKKVYLSGTLFSDGNFSATAKEAAQLAERLQANFKFKVNNGVLHGLDLVKVASLLIRQSESGEKTQFDAFSGLLNVSGKQYHLKNLNISSGLLAGSGQVKVKPNKQLDGVMDVEVKNSVGLAAIPLNVSGTVSNPVVLPSKAALAGAAAGTAILGPGVGTGLGIKAAGALDSVKDLFGGGD